MTAGRLAIALERCDHANDEATCLKQQILSGVTPAGAPACTYAHAGQQSRNLPMKIC
jgi:hypothetical protein